MATLKLDPVSEEELSQIEAEAIRFLNPITGNAHFKPDGFTILRLCVEIRCLRRDVANIGLALTDECDPCEAIQKAKLAILTRSNSRENNS